ncbi:hypothetical protein PILCRDRAFT_748738 [Piloderma croceum F 1598]|uniref:Uncharacterized protein n=1 Tax=Piloderma croceum (strain F 1598) TaxID=765440 RepID=A0A0C3EVH3_PILCF|nr:hypothetical protein PILCRDRAFT_748738 [Piloderma croceum F 1598]
MIMTLDMPLHNPLCVPPAKLFLRAVGMPGKITSYDSNLKQMIMIATAAVVEIFLLGVEAPVQHRSRAEFFDDKTSKFRYLMNIQVVELRSSPVTFDGLTSTLRPQP